MNVADVSNRGDKLQKAHNALAMAQAGRVWLPADDPAFPLADVLAELLRFDGTGATHDDIVDTLAIAASLVLGREPIQRTCSGTVVLRPGLKL
jgi:phage terminase large subunit-like protein